jgi:hypothetical protein
MINNFMQHEHAERRCSKNKQPENAAWIHSMDIQIFISKTCSLDMQKGHNTQHGHGHAARTYSMDM